MLPFLPSAAIASCAISPRALTHIRAMPVLWLPCFFCWVWATGLRYEEPAIEDLYRVELDLNRVGKTRAEGKIKPLRDAVVELLKIGDFNMDVVNWDRLQDAEDAAGRREPEAPEIMGTEELEALPQ